GYPLAPSVTKRARDLDDDGQPVPRLPRTVGFKLSLPVIFRIGMTAALLAMIIVTQRPCADAVSGFVTSFDQAGSAAGSGSATASDLMPKPDNVVPPPQTGSGAGVGSAGDYEQLRPDMTEAELKAAIERAKAKARPN